MWFPFFARLANKERTLIDEYRRLYSIAKQYSRAKGLSYSMVRGKVVVGRKGVKLNGKGTMNGC